MSANVEPVLGPKEHDPPADSELGKEDVDQPVPVGGPTVDPRPSDRPNSLALRASDQVVSVGVAVVVLTLILFRWAQLGGWGLRPLEIDELPPAANHFRLEVNTATETDWSQLDRIGEVLAERIVQDRRERGDFETIDDLLRVEGIGPLTLEQIRPWLTINPSDSRPTPPAGVGSTSTGRM